MAGKIDEDRPAGHTTRPVQVRVIAEVAAAVGGFVANEAVPTTAEGVAVNGS
jgi:hypothetical protein